MTVKINTHLQATTNESIKISYQTSILACLEELRGSPKLLDLCGGNERWLEGYEPGIHNGLILPPAGRGGLPVTGKLPVTCPTMFKCKYTFI